jgi:thiol-disulfide isomerase/thioredoxin
MTKSTALFLAFLLSACAKNKQPLHTGLEGKVLPSFNILLNDSATYVNSSAFSKGQSFVLFYFSPHCPYCRAELDEIIQNKTLLSGIQFYLITDLPFLEMDHFTKEFNLSKYSNIVVGYDPNYSVLNYFRPSGVPYLAIYGKDNKLRKAYLGQLPVNEIKQVISN